MDALLMKQAADHLAERLERLLDDVAATTVEVSRDEALLLLGIVNGVREMMEREAQL